jgi:hypothetical protein
MSGRVEEIDENGGKSPCPDLAISRYGALKRCVA